MVKRSIWFSENSSSISQPCISFSDTFVFVFLSLMFCGGINEYIWKVYLASDVLLCFCNSQCILQETLKFCHKSMGFVILK